MEAAAILVVVDGSGRSCFFLETAAREDKNWRSNCSEAAISQALASRAARDGADSATRADRT
jgi:hypothetical protein